MFIIPDISTLFLLLFSWTPPVRHFCFTNSWIVLGEAFIITPGSTMITIERETQREKERERERERERREETPGG
jgi:hypothetical protein